MSSSIVQHAQPPPPRQGPSRGLDPETLLQAGILNNPEVPDGAHRRARGLARQGSFKAARALLLPHSHASDPAMRSQVRELLGICAARCGGDWEEMFSTALGGYRAARDIAAMARTHTALAEALIVAGRFEEAEAQLAAAYASHANQGNALGQMHVEALRGRIELRAGRILSSLAIFDRAVAALVKVRHPHLEALTRLDRSCAIAATGDIGAAARELVHAERLIAASGHQADRLRARLARAESLLLVGEDARAATGLRRLVAETVDTEDVELRASMHALLGRASATADPTAGRRHLMRARYHYDALSAPLGVASCDVALADLEHRMGLNAYGRLKALTASVIREWPVIQAEARLLHAEMAHAKTPETSSNHVRWAAAFASEHRNAWLRWRVSATARRLGLEVAPTADPEAGESTEPDSAPLHDASAAPPPDPHTFAPTHMEEDRLPRVAGHRPTVRRPRRMTPSDGLMPPSKSVSLRRPAPALRSASGS